MLRRTTKAVCPKCGWQAKGPSIGSHGVVCSVTYIDLFWQKVDKSAGPDACWPFTGSITSWGYGHFNSRHNGEYMAHRLAWELANGRKPPAGVENGTVRHTCDNPPCCNPKHLILGTHLENMQDMAARGRKAVGMKVKQSILTDDDVRAIRRDYRSENRSKSNSKELAAKYGVKVGSIAAILRGATWAHVK